MIEVTKQAPLFSAPAYMDGNVKTFNLEDLRGKWTILVFYPGDFTFVWASEVAAVAAMNDVFKKLDTQVVVISVDSAYVHKAWADQELVPMLDGKKDIPFPMVADQNGAIAKAYGVYSEDASIAMRGRFVIDPEGNIQSYEVMAPPIGRNFKEVVRTVQALQHVRENTSDATPAGWQPGKAVLKPSIELSGNVHKEYNPSKY